jgi:hypothetical protein
MTRPGIEEYVASMRVRYQVAGRRAKGVLLTEVCAVTGFHRKAAIRALRRQPAARGPQRRGRTRPGEVLAALRLSWEAADRPCGQRLAPFLGDLVEALERPGEVRLDEPTRSRLISLSPATVDRWLRPTRTSLPRRPRTGTPSVGGLASEVAIRTWAEGTDAPPGEAQADLVAHCGGTTSGFSLTSLVLVDVATGWLDVAPGWGKSQARSGGALDAARRRFPVPLRARHPATGGEFLNALVQPYCRRRGIRTTRGRASRKNDQAWVEQRTWTAVRRVVGYGRFTSKAAAVQLAAVYALLRPYFNVFQPIRKVIAKERVGGRVRKRYAAARTPYQRLRATHRLAPDQAAALEAQDRALTPLTLLAEIHAARDARRPLAEPDRGWTPTLADRIPGLPPAFAAG